MNILKENICYQVNEEEGENFTEVIFTEEFDKVV